MTKNRKGGFQPIPAGLVDRLAASCTGKGPSDLVFGVLSHPARTLEYDLTLAGIPKETDEGVVDFHALRTTFGTLIVESGANAKVAQRMMRHSDPRITMNIYAKVRPDALNAVAETLGDALNGDDPCATRVQRGKGKDGADFATDYDNKS